MRNLATVLGASVLSLAVAPGCGSSDANADFGGLGSGHTGGAINIGNGAGGTPVDVGSGNGTSVGGGSNTPAGVYDGGQVPITADQIKAVKSASCAGAAVEGETIPSVIELVVDVSSSMNQAARGTNHTKWEVTRDALIEAIVGGNGSPGLGASVAVGLLFYPNRTATIGRQAQDVTACVNTQAMVPPATLGDATAAQRTLLRTALEQVQLQQSTPTHDAYRYAFQNGLSTSNLPGKKFMLLITDGTPTLSLGCMNTSGSLSDVDPEPIVAEVQTVADAGVKTFLIGSPGSESNRNWMSRAAQIGGTATAGCSPNGPTYCHMDMTTAPNFADALRSGLAAIAGQISPCTYTFPRPPSGETIDRDKINVIINSNATGMSQLAVRDDIGDCSQGWQLTPANEILLCKDTCDAVQADPNITVEVVFGCASLLEPPK